MQIKYIELYVVYTMESLCLAHIEGVPFPLPNEGE